MSTRLCPTCGGSGKTPVYARSAAYMDVGNVLVCCTCLGGGSLPVRPPVPDAAHVEPQDEPEYF